MEDYENQLIVLLESAMKYNNVSYPQVAKMIAEPGKKPTRQSVFKKTRSGTMKVTTLLRILDELGIELKLTKAGEEVPVRTAEGERVIRTVKGQQYDTKHCCPVANSFYADGENRYHDNRAEELYFDPKTRAHILVHYSDKERVGRKRYPWIEVIVPDKVDECIESYNLK